MRKYCMWLHFFLILLMIVPIPAHAASAIPIANIAQEVLMKKVSIGFLAIFLCVSSFTAAMAWHDRTHIAVSIVAQFDQAYNLAAPDVTKLKADTVEEYNHWVNNPEKTTITKEMIKG